MIIAAAGQVGKAGWFATSDTSDAAYLASDSSEGLIVLGHAQVHKPFVHVFPCPLVHWFLRPHSSTASQAGYHGRWVKEDTRAGSEDSPEEHVECRTGKQEDMYVDLQARSWTRQVPYYVTGSEEQG